MNYSVYVNAGVPLVVSSALPSTIKQDVLDTLAFARLAADEDVPQGVQDSRWFDIYSGILSACGWSFFAEQQTDLALLGPESTISGQEEMLELAETHLPSGQGLLISAALRRLASASSDAALMQSLKRHCLSAEAGSVRFRAMAGVVEAGGFLGMVSVSFDTQGKIDPCYWESGAARHTPVGNVIRRGYSARFNQALYDEFRADTREWLAAELHPPSVEIGPLFSEKH
jgi:hypothetical protein